MCLYRVKKHLIRAGLVLATICSSYANIVNLSECSLSTDEVAQLQELMDSWQTFYKNNDYRDLMTRVKPLVDGCGIIYELKNEPISSTRLHETICIVDMTKVVGATEPHFHRKGIEIYLILQGTGIVVVGDQEYSVKPGDSVYIPTLLGHYTVPTKDLVLAVVNIPCFDRDDFFDLNVADDTVRTMVKYDHAHYLRLKDSNITK